VRKDSADAGTRLRDVSIVLMWLVISGSMPEGPSRRQRYSSAPPLYCAYDDRVLLHYIGSLLNWALSLRGSCHDHLLFAVLY